MGFWGASTLGGILRVMGPPEMGRSSGTMFKEA